MKRFIISGICISGNGSMGGNTKIALEVARFISDKLRKSVWQNQPSYT